MAGSLAIIPIDQIENPMASISSEQWQWEIQFSRFFNYPPLSSTCPDLAPLPPKVRNRRPHGTWISSSSSSSSSAFLRLLNDTSNSDVILAVSFRGKMLVITPPFSTLLQPSSFVSFSFRLQQFQN